MKRAVVVMDSDEDASSDESLPIKAKKTRTRGPEFHAQGDGFNLHFIPGIDDADAAESSLKAIALDELAKREAHADKNCVGCRIFMEPDPNHSHHGIAAMWNCYLRMRAKARIEVIAHELKLIYDEHVYLPLKNSGQPELVKKAEEWSVASIIAHLRFDMTVPESILVDLIYDMRAQVTQLKRICYEEDEHQKLVGNKDMIKLHLEASDRLAKLLQISPDKLPRL